MKVNVLFVCLGNICRSPTAHGLFQSHINQAGLSDVIIVDSAGTGDWHVGEAPDRRAQSTALANGYDISHLRGRCVERDDFLHFDYILAMDNQNLGDLQKIKPDSYQGTLGLFLDVAVNANGFKKPTTATINKYATAKILMPEITEVPDPYYGDDEHFKKAIKLIDNGSKNLLNHIRGKHGV